MLGTDMAIINIIIIIGAAGITVSSLLLPIIKGRLELPGLVMA